MDRRKFIKTVGLTAGATLFSGLGLAGTTELFNDKTNYKMKIVVLTGSPRRNGNTNYLAGQFIKGAEEAGHEVYRFDCAQHKVSPCIACNRCGMNGQCVFDDDFAELRPHLIAADMVVFATPMYYFGFSAQLKTVIDRFYAINGQIKGVSKRSAFLMAYANTDPKEAEPMISHYHTLLHYLDWKDSGMVVAPGMWPTGTVNNTEYSRRAYELGRNIKYVAMKHDMDIPTEPYEDDAVCYIASRYHVSTQEAVRGFLVQIGIVHGEMSDFHLEDNEIEIMNGLMDAYSSTKGENLNTWNDGQKKFFAKVIDGSIAGSQ